jgi:2'-5' RNA ligase
LWPDDAVRRRCATITASFGNDGRAVPSDNFHLTLKFLGSVEPSIRACVERAGDSVRAHRFTLTLNEIGRFAASRVLWLGSAITPAPLQTLVTELDRMLTACGIAPETRPFAPHVTLRRNVRHAPRGFYFEAVHWSVHAFCLVCSETRAEGPVYTVIRKWNFD